MPSATSRATAGATIAWSSSPSAPFSPACGLSPATTSRGRGMRNRAERSRATIRPVSTTSSVERCWKISFSGRWIVTGTTASSGDQSIITGRSCRPVASCTSVARNSVWPGSAKPQLYSTFFATGLVTIAEARPARTSATARRMEAMAAGALDRSGCPGSALTTTSMGTTGSADENVAQAEAGVTIEIETSSPSCAARRRRNSGSETT